jgi:hypothetical protein
MRLQLSVTHRVARLSSATLLGVLLGCVLTGSALSGALAPNAPAWRFGAPVLSVLFLPPALSLWLDARLRRSWQAQFRALCGIVLVGAGLVDVSIILSASDAKQSNGNSPAALAILAAFLLGAPLIFAAAPAFTIGGIGGYSSSWAPTAVWAGVLAWVGAGVAVLPATYLWYFVLNPCHSSGNLFRGGSLCVGPAITSFLLFAFAVGVALAPLGGLVGGALRAWVGQSVRAV